MIIDRIRLGMNMNRIGKWLLGVGILIFSFDSAAYCQEGFFRDVTWILQGGLFHGSIVGRNEVDGMSGATKTLWSASAGAEVNIKGHYLQTGITIGKTDQHVNYVPPPDMFVIAGERDISLLLLDVPILYNFHFLSEHAGGGDKSCLIASAGGFASFVLSKRIDLHGSMTPAKMSNWALGPFFKLAWFPLDFGRMQPGIFLDFYRSFFPKYFFDHPYFKQNDIAGQLGIINTGISFRIQ
jgi:hypothetical protein